MYGKIWVVCKFRIVGREEIKSKKCLGKDDVGIYFTKLVWFYVNFMF